MKNLVRFAYMFLLIVTISAIAVPALASGWEDRYGPDDLRINGTQDKRYVKNLQSDLNEVLGSLLTVDGIFGTSTQKAVIRFQTIKHLSPDGIVGDATKKALWNAVGN